MICYKGLTPNIGTWSLVMCELLRSQEIFSTTLCGETYFQQYCVRNFFFYFQHFCSLAVQFYDELIVLGLGCSFIHQTFLFFAQKSSASPANIPPENVPLANVLHTLNISLFCIKIFSDCKIECFSSYLHACIWGMSENSSTFRQ